jgi:hypothetical protein
MWLDLDKAITITAGSAVWARGSFAFDTDLHSVIDACRNRHIKFNSTSRLTFAAAMIARIRYDSAGTAAVGTCRLNSEYPGRLYDLTLSLTATTCFALRTRLTARSTTSVTRFSPFELNGLVNAGGSFVQRENNLAFDVCPATRSPTSTTASPSATPAKEIVKNVLEDIANVVGTLTATAATALKRRVTVPVVGGAFLRVIEDFIRFG